jgi:hypothetical protein
MLLRRIFAFLLTALSAAVCAAAEPGVAKFVQTHCLDCHHKATHKGELDLEKLLSSEVGKDSQAWEKVVRKLSARQMPPKDAPRPKESEYGAALASLETALDAAAAKAPNPGRTETFRRLNRTEYQNAIRDLLDLDIDAAALLPADELSHGFDNITVADLSPTLLNRYISAAQKISRLAVGSSTPGGETIRLRPDITQDSHVEGLPLGTRGGALIAYNFPADGEYEIQIRLMRDRNEGVEGLHEPHELEVLLDRERVEQFTVKPPGKEVTQDQVDAHLKTRLDVKAGPHKLGVTFIKKASSLLESPRQPLNVHFNYYRHPRLGPAIYEVSIVGPTLTRSVSEDSTLTRSVSEDSTLTRSVSEDSARVEANTPSRRRIFITKPKNAAEEEGCAKTILANLARQAYRRPVDDADLKPILSFYEVGRKDGDFETGIEAALASLLVKPQFLFRIERDPPNVSRGEVYHISDLELASRLSFFLWSSSPDEELLRLAEKNELHQPEVLEKQVRRMLADERSESLVTNFASQWLYLRNLEAVNLDMRLYPDFDDNLRQAMRRETELLFSDVVRDDRSALGLLKTDHAWLNERLAKHYGIPHIYGSHFRRVPVSDDSQRGGLLRQGSILTVTSYATRTSPVIRGHWVLQNLVGNPPPPPPPDVPALDGVISDKLSIRERLKQHRENTACASCHEQMDPVGFALENFDAIGRWRKTDAGQRIDASGRFIDGSQFTGVAGLERALLDRPELFVQTLTEKLLTFALGRGVEYYDAPAVRQIIRDAKKDDYRFSKLILGIVSSTPFQMRKAP